MKLTISLVLVSAFYAAVWVPLILPTLEPFGSGGFALTHASIIFGISWAIVSLIHLALIAFRRPRPILPSLVIDVVSIAICLAVVAWMSFSK